MENNYLFIELSPEEEISVVGGKSIQDLVGKNFAQNAINNRKNQVKNEISKNKDKYKKALDKAPKKPKPGAKSLDYGNANYKRILSSR
jgi:hypothetical protein